jgi:hypothetical protein
MTSQVRSSSKQDRRPPFRGTVKREFGRSKENLGTAGRRQVLFAAQIMRPFISINRLPCLISGILAPPLSGKTSDLPVGEVCSPNKSEQES